MVLIVLGALIAPVAVTTAWVKAVMLDTDRFVATFAPLAADPAIQEVVSRQTSEAVLERLDPEQLTADVFDGLSQLDLPPRSRVALQRLEGATAAALSSLVTRVVDDIVRSEEFPKLFEQTLRVSHEQLIAALEGDPEALLRFGADQRSPSSSVRWPSGSSRPWWTADSSGRRACHPSTVRSCSPRSARCASSS